MVNLEEVAQAWKELGFGNVTRGNTFKNNMEYFLSCTNEFNRYYHIHLLTYDNGKAKLKSLHNHTDLMVNINNETDPIHVAVKLFHDAGYHENNFCKKNKVFHDDYKIKYLKYKKKYLELKNILNKNNNQKL